MRYSLRTLLILLALGSVALVLAAWLAMSREEALDWLGGIIATGVGTLLVGIGVWSLIHAVRQIMYWPKTTAVVLRYWVTRSENEPDGQRFYHPVLKFKTSDDQNLIAISPSGYWRKTWSTGSVVAVRYNPENPRWTEIASLWNLWAIPLTFIGLPAAMAFIHLWFRW